MAAAIETEGVGKRYSRAVTPTLLDLLKGIFLRHGEKCFWALENVSFRVGKGEVLGIVGPNGAGKTTLLRLLAGVSRATRGRITVRGRTANLIDLTAGFHPELTGRENVYLQAALLGMSRREVQTRFDAIVEFADIGAFLDTPVKKYSAGMLARIGFSIAIHTEPDVLLVDEVLAVGDARFQSKCLRRIRAMRERGVATVLVSHNMAAITALATHVLWLDQGKIRARGQALDVVDAYLRHSAKANEEEAAGRSFPVQDNGPLRVESVRLLSGNTPAKDFKFRDALSVEICYFAKEPVERPFFTVAAVRDGLTLFHASMRWDGHAPERIEGRGVLRCTFESLPLHPGVYQMVLRVSDPTMSFTYIPTMPIGMFQIVSPLSAYGYREETAVPVVHDSPYIAVPYRWEHRAEKTPHD